MWKWFFKTESFSAIYLGNVLKIYESLFFTDLSAVQAARQITRINSGFCITSFICTVLFHCQNIMFLPNNNNLREKQLKKLCNAFQKLDSLFSLSVSISQSWCQPANVTEWAIRNIKSVPRCRDANALARLNLWSARTGHWCALPLCLLPGLHSGQWVTQLWPARQLALVAANIWWHRQHSL